MHRYFLEKSNTKKTDSLTLQLRETWRNMNGGTDESSLEVLKGSKPAAQMVYRLPCEKTDFRFIQYICLV